MGSAIRRHSTLSVGTVFLIVAYISLAGLSHAQSLGVTISEMMRGQLQASRKVEVVALLARHIRQRGIVFCGMGGSSLPVGLFQIEHPTIDVTVVRDYAAPSWMDLSKMRVVAISYSGTTEETISCARDALARGARVDVITRNPASTLASMVAEDRVHLVELPQNAVEQPRLATLAIWMAIERILYPKQAEALSMRLESAINVWSTDVVADARGAVASIGNAMPIFVSDSEFRVSAEFARILVNENAKRVAFVAELPELNHNLMQGFMKTEGSFQLVYLHHGATSFASDKLLRYRVLCDLLRGEAPATVACHEVQLPGQSPDEAAVAALLWSYEFSLLFAEATGVDPLSVPWVEEFKSELRRRRVSESQ